MVDDVPAKPEEEENVFVFSVPLQTHDGLITKVKLKMPKAKAFITYGQPYTLIREGGLDAPRVEWKFYPKIMFKFAAEMTGIDENLLEGIQGNDVEPLYWAIVEMLGNRPK